jgi:hypothetical protein
MKKLLIIISVLLILKSGYAQQNNSDSITTLFKHALKGNPVQFVFDNKERFSRLDSITQSHALDYLYTYEKDPLIYLNINKLHQLLEIFYSSSYVQIRQRATNLILKTYRIAQGTTTPGWVWYAQARLSDFNEEAKAQIMKIIKCEPLSETERDLLYKYEFYTSQNFYKNDTLFIRDYRKNTKLSLNELRDSVATAVAKDNIENINPSKYLEDLGMYYLASWLYMYEAIPYIEKVMMNDSPQMRKYYKLPLARLGNKEYENELLDSMYRNNFDYHVIGFLRTANALEAIIESLKKLGQATIKIPMHTREGRWVEAEVEQDPYNCVYLRQLIYKNLIPELPFKFNDLSLSMCEISEAEINKVVEWLEQNRDRIVLNRDYH